MSEEKLLTVDEAARYFSVRKTTIYKWIDEEKLKCIRLNNRIRFTKNDIREFVLNDNSSKNEQK